MFLAQAPTGPEYNFWAEPSGSAILWIKMVVSVLVGIGIIIALLNAPTRIRRPLIAAGTFIAGSFFLLSFFWPKPADGVTEAKGVVEGVGVWLRDSTATVSTFSQILTTFLFGLGIYSIISINGKKIIRRQKDWQFSLALFVSLLVMAIFGYGDWIDKTQVRTPDAAAANPSFWNVGMDFIFDGLLQQMEAAMFSIIAFFIISAAYRAFRIRSVESTIMLSTALIVMLSLMGLVVVKWDDAFGNTLGGNLQLTEIAKFIGDNCRLPGLQAIGYGIGIATVAMAMRIWLSLDKGGLN